MFFRMNKISPLFWAFLLVLVIVSIATALAATNIVPVTHLLDSNSPVWIGELAPPECASILNTLEVIVDCSIQGSTCSGSGNVNELILGTSGDETLDGKSGDDCIVGGGGNDTLLGGNGNDVLLGGPGSDALYGEGRNKDTDTCLDDPSMTYFDASCEVTP